MFIVLIILQDLFKVYPSLKSFINFKFYISHRDNALVDVDRVEERLLQVEFNYRLKSPMGIYKTLPKINILSKGKPRFLFNCIPLTNQNTWQIYCHCCIFMQKCLSCTGKVVM